MEAIGIQHASDDSVVVRFEERIDPSVNEKVHRAAHAIQSAGLGWVRDIVPSYREVLVTYDLGKVDPMAAIAGIRKAIDAQPAGYARPQRVNRIPVCYGGSYGPDMDFVCRHTGMSEPEIVSLHSKQDYLIYMIGFTIGFPYLGGMDPRLEAPRLDAPREKVAAGSVGIAGKQTGIYTLPSPGGWRIIGRSPVRLVDTTRMPPAVLSAGDYIRFYAIDEHEFEQIRMLAEKGKYEIESTILTEEAL